MRQRPNPQRQRTNPQRQRTLRIVMVIVVVAIFLSFILGTASLPR